MGTSYGPGMLSSLPGFEYEDAQVEALLNTFAQGSGCFELREVVGERVARWFQKVLPGTSIVDPDSYGFEWLEGEAAQEVVEHQQNAGNGV
ncbi:hypothetical protein OAX78_04075, partial [Planctomycetota bacterium]|nr:hypothetical protein [Planctomycetota bacterium]